MEVPFARPDAVFGSASVNLSHPGKTQNRNQVIVRL